MLNHIDEENIDILYTLFGKINYNVWFKTFLKGNAKWNLIRQEICTCESYTICVKKLI